MTKDTTKVARLVSQFGIAGLVWVISTSLATANPFIQFGPYGSVGYRNYNGAYDFFYPSRYQAGAGMPQPGTFQQNPFGQTWIGSDGMIHGNMTDPMTGDTHFFSKRRPGSYRTFQRPPRSRQGRLAPSMQRLPRRVQRGI